MLYRISDFCETFKVSRNTLRKWRAEGAVREVRPHPGGRIVLIDPAPLYESGVVERLNLLDLKSRVGV